MKKNPRVGSFSFRSDADINLAPTKDITEKIKKIVSFSEMATIIMSNGLPQDKKDFLGQICSNLTLTDKNVSVTTLPEIKVFIDGLNRAKAENPLFEPQNIVDVSERNPIFMSVADSLLRTWDDVRNCLK
jgi:hypothetical protein